ncbi:hypothetical protein EVA_08510 [gut metagenome]|uniref:Uncharacterized protein n=1 Tax=gut metagenome TaxID=749906 RepID=J9GSW8_9ZZZZ
MPAPGFHPADGWICRYRMCQAPVVVLPYCFLSFLFWSKKL